MAKVLNDYLVDLKIDLKSTTAWSDAELTRCVERAVADLTRFRPREMSAEFIVDADVDDESFTTPAAADPDKYVDNMDLPNTVVDTSTATLTGTAPDMPRPVAILVTNTNSDITSFTIRVKGTGRGAKYIEEDFYFSGGLSQTGKKYFETITEIEFVEITGNTTGDKLDIGTATNVGVFVQLANKPIKFQSDGDITGFTRYTDYVMDYYGGRIAMKSGGSMVAATAYTIDYTKSKIAVDISDLKDLVRVERVEYPAGSVPQQMSTKEVWGNILTLTSDGWQSQGEASDDEHVLVHYLAQHQPPSDNAPGTYPSFLDWTVELAASAYALFIEALQYELAAAASITSLEGALTNATKYLDNNAGADATGLLADIAANIAEIRTKIIVATGAMNNYLDDVAATDLDAATVGATAWLLEGELLINQLNDGGADVATKFADYARTKVQIANARIQAASGYAQEVAARLSDLRAYIETSAGYNRVGEAFVAEADRYQQAANTNLQLADRFRAEAVERRNEAWAIWGSPSQYAPQYTMTPVRQTKE